MKIIKKKPTKIYISGPITGDPDYVAHFKQHREKLENKGFQVLDPTVWTRENLKLSYEEYMALDLAMLEVCDAIYMMPGWANSRGALRELDRATELKLKIYYSN